MGWSPDSWRGLEARQQPDYPDPAALAAATRELAAYPPLVDATDVETLRAALAEAQAGRAFLLQGGDCAESFAEFAPETIRANHALMGAMAATIGNGTGVSVVRIGRIAGQFAKPRSEPLEERDGIALPAWRGDIVNGIAFNATARRPDPERMFRAYGQAAATLAHLGRLSGDSRFFTAHEMLLLRFEEALVRRQDDKFYASSAHFLWIGDRTRFAGSAHVEFARGIANPIGIKCGPTLQPDELLRLLDLLDPHREPGRITLISRMGDAIDNALPPLLRAVAGSGHLVLWCCDPMHGNTMRTGTGAKTRPLERIVAETLVFFSLTRSEGAIPGGLHIEMTGRDVAECTGGAEALTEADLTGRYHTHCDPRLNAAQALELAGLVAGELNRNRRAPVRRAAV